MVQIVQNKKIPFIVSGVLFVASAVLLALYGLKPGIEFTGGSLFEFDFAGGERPDQAAMQETLAPLNLGNVLIQPTGDTGYILKLRFTSEEEHQAILGALREAFEEDIIPTATINEEGKLVLDPNELAQGRRVIETRVETIGPAISSELASRSVSAVIIVLIAIVLFIAYSFRKVSQPVSSWKYGITAIIALVHDVVITMGLFALLGHTLGVEIDIPFVVALLTILGYSINDTIVVFDRIREKLIRRGRDSFAETVNRGVNETIMRSVNTSLTTLLVLLALFFFGGVTIHYFALALIVGIALGTYSSIFIASPLLVVWQERSRS